MDILDRSEPLLVIGDDEGELWAKPGGGDVISDRPNELNVLSLSVECRVGGGLSGEGGLSDWLSSSAVTRPDLVEWVEVRR